MEKKFESLRKKVFMTMLIVVIITIGLVSGLIFYRLSNVKATLENSHEQVRQQTVGTSSETTRRQALNQLTASTKAGAQLCDDVFLDFKRSVETIAANAARLYENQDEYASVDVKRPDRSNAGTLTVQLLYSAFTNENSPEIKRETGLLGNLQNTLLSVHENYEPIVADCIATESGIMIMADLISDTKFDENGGYLPYEANTRPWYIGVMDTKETFFTKLSRDAHTSKTGIMCGAPVFYNEEIVAVVEAGMYLDNLEAAIADAAKDQTEGANICIINEDGELVCSTAKSGVLAADFENMTDLRESGDKILGGFLTKAISGKTNVAELELDGIGCYAVSAPLETVGWTYVITIPAETVDADTKVLASALDEIGQNATKETNAIMSDTIRNVIVMAIIVLISVAVLANVMSQRLVAPIKELTDKVKSIDGDDLDFSFERKENDEIYVLANAFQTMTVRMKNYIEEVKTITAEKERIGAELNVATQIQADMLPRIFPPFPERKEFDLYATMDPAKEVGGDFYDFFLVDDDHLALVMADVSGKGVPAALFMVIAKTLIKNYSLMGNGSPAQILMDVNDQLCEGNEAELFVTVWLAIIEISTGKGLAANAGHEHPAIKRADGNWELVVYRHSPAVATMEGIRFKEHEFELHPGDRLYVYTDGVAEATDANNELYGADRMIEALNKEPEAPPEKLLKNVRADIDAFVGEAPQFDDITMLGLAWYGAGGAEKEEETV